MGSAREEIEDHRNSRFSSVAGLLFIGFFLYLLPLLVVTVDELVLGTYWFLKNGPDNLVETLHTIYPFVRFFVD